MYSLSLPTGISSPREVAGCTNSLHTSLTGPTIPIIHFLNALPFLLTHSPHTTFCVTVVSCILILCNNQIHNTVVYRMSDILLTLPGLPESQVLLDQLVRIHRHEYRRDMTHAMTSWDKQSANLPELYCRSTRLLWQPVHTYTMKHT